eukprot:m.382397 g.382397  ORF g.382397 m.382397 type:complete len:860 (+) comp16719_c1_seq2:2-2581(+)
MLMFCGNGAVGKTTLALALQDERGRVDPAVAKEIGRTPGFNVIAATIPKAGDCTIVDFAGQTEFWVPNGLFLKTRSGVFVVVCNLGDPPETLWKQLRYWLRFIVSRADEGDRPRVAIVGTHRGAGAAIRDFLKENSFLPDADKAPYVDRLKRLEAIRAVADDRWESAEVERVVSTLRNEFKVALDMATRIFYVESVSPSDMDTAEMNRLIEWLSTEFTRIRTTHQVPKVCIDVARLLDRHVKKQLPAVASYTAVMAVLEMHSEENVDFTDEDRNLAVFHYLTQSGHIMFFEDINRTVVTNPQAFGLHVIGQLFSPGHDPQFESLVVRPEDGFKFTRSSLEKCLERAHKAGHIFGPSTNVLQLLIALGLVFPMSEEKEGAEADASQPREEWFAVPGRLSHDGVDFSQPKDCWEQPEVLGSWAYLGVRLTLTSKLTLIPPSAMPRLQHRLSGRQGFRMWRHGLRVCDYDEAGKAQAEAVIVLNEELEFVDVCVRSKTGHVSLCAPLLIELVRHCEQLGVTFEGSILDEESIRKHGKSPHKVAIKLNAEADRESAATTLPSSLLQQHFRHVLQKAPTIPEEALGSSAASAIPATTEIVGAHNDPLDCSQCGTDVRRTDAAYAAAADRDANNDLCVWRASGRPTLYYSIHPSLADTKLADGTTTLGAMLQQAGAVWGKVIEIVFEVAPPSEQPHFNVFDGAESGGVYAKAFFPGDYKAAKGQPRDLIIFPLFYTLDAVRQLHVLVHELGHILGLVHNGQAKFTAAGKGNPALLASTSPNVRRVDTASVMYAQVATRETLPESILSQEDAAAAKFMYSFRTSFAKSARAEVVVEGPGARGFIIPDHKECHAAAAASGDDGCICS